jgi:hypothetical protein
MNLTVAIKELGRLDRPSVEPVALSAPGETMTLASMIRQTVERQLAAHDDKLAQEDRGPQAVNLGYLTDADIEIGEESGKIAVEAVSQEDSRSLEHRVRAYQEHALQAFRLGRFAVLVNGEQLDDLDMELSESECSEIVFLRVVPFVGG